MNNTRSKGNRYGRLGENIAIRWLITRGYRVIETNWKYRNMGELDVVACRTEADIRTIYFIEVKSRVTHETEETNVVEKSSILMPEDSCSEKKIRRIKHLGELYVLYRDLADYSVEFVLLAIDISVKRQKYVVRKYVL